MGIKARFEPQLDSNVYFIAEQGKPRLGFSKNRTQREIDYLSVPLSVHICITNRCNLECSHCYAREFINTSNEESIEGSINSLLDMLARNNVFVIEWSGGEPFMASQFIDIVEYANSLGFYQGIITNGTLNNAMEFERIKKTNTSLEISLDGDEFSVDTIKGIGVYKKVMNTVTLCRENNIPHIVKITILNENIDSLYSALSTLIIGGVSNIKLGLLLPVGGASTVDYEQYIEHTIPKAKDIIRQVRKESGNRANIISPFDASKKQIAPMSRRALLCEAGMTRLFIDNNGDCYPCPLFKTFSEFCAGNILHDTLSTIWSSRVMQDFRAINPRVTGCESCSVLCGFWCRAIAYAYSNNIAAKSILCQKIER